MSVERADRLLKAAGFNGEYTGVRICATRTLPLMYCFMKVTTGPETIVDAVVVEISISNVREIHGGWGDCEWSST